MSELRWNPVLEEWVITATHRQERIFFPRDYCPLCPTMPDSTHATEVPAASYDLVVFENKFPSLQRNPPIPMVTGTDLYPVRPADGTCEVVLYSPEHSTELAKMPVRTVEKLMWVWADRFEELGSREEVKFVLLFENKGREIGVTLDHPHGQIYAYPFIPPIIQKELNSCRDYFEAHDECLLCRILRDELADGRRIIAQNHGFVALIPFYARYPYEVHIFARPHKNAITDFCRKGRRCLAEIIHTIVVKYNNLWPERPSLPYMMVTHQRPTDGMDYPYYHFHLEFYPPYRTPDKLKYLAGSEAGVGTYINDTLPEETAEKLRKAEPRTRD